LKVFFKPRNVFGNTPERKKHSMDYIDLIFHFCGNQTQFFCYRVEIFENGLQILVEIDQFNLQDLQECLETDKHYNKINAYRGSAAVQH
jgi:hypothetical protein